MPQARPETASISPHTAAAAPPSLTPDASGPCTVKLKGRPLRIVPATRAGKAVWLVVAGPFPTRAAAERAGRAANHDYWTYEGAP